MARRIEGRTKTHLGGKLEKDYLSAVNEEWGKCT